MNKEVPQVVRWTEVLTLRPELIAQNGQLSDLQMSLFDAVYQTKNVPYRDVGYYGEITEPTPRMVGFMADVLRRLGTTTNVKALYHLDQGMGGGKSHALVGLYHMAKNPTAFFDTEIGQRVHHEAELRASEQVDLKIVRPVVLSADNMTPGKPNPEFGPAVTLFERFLWSLFNGDHAAYDKFVAQGADKASLHRAMGSVGSPILILLDELMDYALALSDAAHVAGMPGEQAFLNALMDAVDEVPQVAFVTVMMRSDVDDRGYDDRAEGFRDYITRRLERNGVTVSVTEAPDFAAIIRRRIFQPPPQDLPTKVMAEQWKDECTAAWVKNVLDRLPSDRSLVGFADRLQQTYPFHPDLMSLVREDWSPHAGFQRVRSTVEIFARTAYHWQQQHQQGRWVPELIGVGDIPLTAAIEQVLSSGLLHGNDRAIQMFRQVAAKDITSWDGTQGHAVALDHRFAKDHPGLHAQPHPCVRMATALFVYSLVPRAQARRGATKEELLASVYTPDKSFSYTDAEEVFNLLIDDEQGLGALEIIAGAESLPTRYRLSVTHTLRMFFRQAKAMVDPAVRDQDLWELIEDLSNKGPFDAVVHIGRPKSPLTPLSVVFDKVDEAMKNRLVILDPRRWTLLNGKDADTRSDISALFGLGDQGLCVDNAASCIVACVNTQRWEMLRKKANDWQAWKIVVGKTLDQGDELYPQAQSKLKEDQKEVGDALRSAFHHFAFLIWTKDGVAVEWRRFDDEKVSALSGNQVWAELVKAHRAVVSGTLKGDYLKALLDVSQRNFTLKEVVRKFWQDSNFPMVPDPKEVRRAIFEALQGDDRWEIVDGHGTVLTILSPDQLAINSMDQVVRRAAPAKTLGSTVSEGQPVTGQDWRTDSGTGGGTEWRLAEEPEREGRAPTPTYRRFRIELRNRSVADPTIRKQVFNLLSELTDVLDPTSGTDIQLVDLNLTVTAAEGSMDGAKAKAADAGASWMEEEEDF